MAIKRKGILARPGKYRYGDHEEVKTAEELRAAAERQPIIVLTRGHPPNGIPTADRYMGTVSQKWSDRENAVIGDFWFYEEYTPPYIREKIVNEEPVPISAGFTLEKVENGVQKGILYTHVAVLDGENPVCPLGQCGVNVPVRAEAEEANIIMRYEQQTQLGEAQQPAEGEKPSEAEETPATTTIPTAELDALRAEITALKEMLAEMKGPAAEKAEDETQSQKAEQAEAQSKAPIEPETVIPRPVEPPAEKPKYEWEDGEVATGNIIFGATSKE